MVAVAGRQALAFARVAAVVLLCITGWQLGKGNGELGVNWGTISHDPLPNNIVVKLLQDNNFAKTQRLLGLSRTSLRTSVVVVSI